MLRIASASVQPKVTVVVPTLNEARNLPHVFSRLPRWFRPEYYWAIGCSYQGMPESAAPARNVWTANIATCRIAFDAADGFRKGFGKVGARSRPEDTDLCLRAAECVGGGSWIYEPDAIARHQIPAGRTTFHYFLRRCYYEGQGMAALVSFSGSTESISEERQYTRRILSYGIMRGGETARGEAPGIVRNFAIVAGLSFAVAGFFVDRTIEHVMARDTEHAASRSTLSHSDRDVRARYQNAVHCQALADEKVYLNEIISEAGVPEASHQGAPESLRPRKVDRFQCIGAILLRKGAAVPGALVTRVGRPRVRRQHGEPR